MWVAPRWSDVNGGGIGNWGSQHAASSQLRCAAMRAKMAVRGFFGENSRYRHSSQNSPKDTGRFITNRRRTQFSKYKLIPPFCDGFNSLGKKFNNLSWPRPMSIFMPRDPTIPVQCSQQSSTDYAMGRRTPLIMSLHLSSSMQFSSF